jgi:hypothetical protein
MSHRYRSQNETRVPRLHSPGQGVIGSSARSPLAHDLLCAAPQAYHRIGAQSTSFPTRCSLTAPHIRSERWDQELGSAGAGGRLS